MNQLLLTRLFKSIEGDQDTPLIKVAYSIIEDEKKKGHIKLANKLSIILKAKLDKANEFSSTLKVAKGSNTFKIPLDRRYRLPLATHI
ncbi:MAG: ATP-binding protein, partial [Cyanobacteria bacterium J06649_11]